jgi:DNA-binding SARP family transcriptional activator
MREGMVAFLQGEQRVTHQRLTVQAQHGGIRGGTAGAVRVWLLGGFEVSAGSRAVEDSSWRLRKAQSLVKLLALVPGHRVHRERIMDVLWPDRDVKSQANNLHGTLHLARKVLGGSQANAAAPCLRLKEDLVALCPEGQLWVDVEAFEGAAATARRSREPAAYRAALDLYTGELLPEDRYEPWAEGRREGLRRLHHTLLIELAALHEERGEYAPAVEALERAAAEEPAHEVARMGLMRLYVAEGRRNEAIIQYWRLRKTLSEELGVNPTGASRRLYEEIRAGRSPTAPPPHPARLSGEPASTAPNNLPVPLTSFVGRDTEVLEVKRTLSMTRLLTLTGAGGAGKTRLALEVARDLIGTYPGGGWLVELAPVSDPTLVPRAVAAALGVREQPDRSLTQTLCNRLRSGHTLVVLDNCEHLIDAAARLVKDLLSACANLRVLATSREPLGISGESVWPVPTLSLPNPEAQISVETLMGAEAVRLFVERTRSRLPSFELTPENARSVATICRDLEGLPLAIELSTARMGALAVEQVAERLEDSLKLLTGGDRTVAPRHQTLRATLDWSYGLLSEPERRLFGRLSVFAGGWTLEAAEAVGAQARASKKARS